MTEEPVIGWTEALGQEASNPSESRTTGDTIIALGREWVVASCENRIKAQFEMWVRRHAKRAIAEAEAEEGPEEASHMRSAYIADLGSGHYTWDGRHVRSARSDLPGLRYLLFLLLRRCQEDITEEQVAAIFKEDARGCGVALRWALGNSEAPPTGKPETGTKGGNGMRQERMPRTFDAP